MQINFILFSFFFQASKRGVEKVEKLWAMDDGSRKWFQGKLQTTLFIKFFGQGYSK